MPTSRNARGVDVIAYNSDATRIIGVQVKTLSKQNPVPLGTSTEKFMGDYWVIVTNVASKQPSSFVMLPEEVRSLAHCGKKDDRVSYWLWRKHYDQEHFREAWERIK